MKDAIIQEAKKLGPAVAELSDFIHDHPELGNEETRAAEKLTAFLANAGFQVERGLGSYPTAFRASFKASAPGPSIAYLCEYDALPEMGHGCGHCMIGSMSVGAAVALSRHLPCGEILVFGTPAEETNGAKVELAKDGYFEGIAAAMILHPGEFTEVSGSSLAMDALEFAFTGKASHAAASPEKGINALDGAILLFNGINALRQHLPAGVKVHGIITEGGKAPNIVPERAVARFYVRALKRATLDEVVEKVKAIAQGAALMTGATLEIHNYELSYDDMNTNQVLSEAFNENLRRIGVTDIRMPEDGLGSIDMGNVSQKAPAIHPYIGIGAGLVGHTPEFAAAVVTPRAHEALVEGVAALALTGYDVLTDEGLRGRIQQEFAKG